MYWASRHSLVRTAARKYQQLWSLSSFRDRTLSQNPMQGRRSIYLSVGFFLGQNIFHQSMFVINKGIQATKLWLFAFTNHDSDVYIYIYICNGSYPSILSKIMCFAVCFRFRFVISLYRTMTLSLAANHLHFRLLSMIW